MKGRYDIYPLLLVTISRLMRRELGKLNQRECIDMLFRENPATIDALEFLIMAQELHWLETSCHVIFPESGEILDKLLSSRFSLSKSTGFVVPHETFSLAFPRGYEIEGQQAQGCIITYMNYDERRDAIHRRFCRYINQNIGYKPAKEYADNRSLSVSYCDPENTSKVIMFTVPEVLIPACLMAKNAEEYGSIVGTYTNQSMKPFQVALTTDEHRYQFKLLQLIVRLSVYSRAYDKALIEGYPEARPKHLEPRGIHYKDSTLRMEKVRLESKAHYRSWHFRQLLDEKYYRGEHANEPVGSRIVFVRDTFVNQEVLPETLHQDRHTH